MYEDYLAGEIENALVMQMMRQEPAAFEWLSTSLDPTPCVAAKLRLVEPLEHDMESKAASKGEGVLSPPASLVFVVDPVDEALLCNGLELRAKCSGSVGPLQPDASSGYAGPLQPDASAGSAGPLQPDARSGSAGPLQPDASSGSAGPLQSDV